MRVLKQQCSSLDFSNSERESLLVPSRIALSSDSSLLGRWMV